MSLTLLLRTDDIARTRAFYASVLGFDTFDSAEGSLTVERFGGTLVFTGLWGAPDGFSGTIYFTVPDADAFFASIRERVDVSWPIQDMPHGSREFGIRDCNGYHLAFQQRV